MKFTSLLFSLMGTLIPGLLQANTDQVNVVWNWQQVPKYEEYNDFPNGKNKWTAARQEEKRKELLQFIKGIRKAAPSEVKAFPSAEDFPGIPANGTKLVSRTISFNPQVQGWASTGLYALPGVKVTVNIPDTVNLKKENGKPNYEVRIGCHTDKLSLSKRHSSWSRTPEISYSAPISSPTTEITSPSGGLVYICSNVDDGNTEKPFSVTISPAAAAPTFILNKTSPEDWEKQLQETTVPWGEIVCPRVIVSLPLSDLKQMPNIEEVAQHLQKGMEAEDWLAGWDQVPGELKRPMRFVVDRQISAGGGHSGYPTMGLSYWSKAFRNGSIASKGHWGLWHELGHNHQRPPVRLNTMGEVTVNFFTLVAHVKAANIPAREALSANEKTQQAIYDYIKSDKNFFDISSDHGVRLQFFKEIMLAFGFEPFRHASLKYNKEPYDNKKLNDQEKWDWYFVALSEGTKKNLGPYFDLWKVNISPEAKAKVAQLPKWLPSPNYPDYDKSTVK